MNLLSSIFSGGALRPKERPSALEDSSTGATQQFAASVELRNKSNISSELLCPSPQSVSSFTGPASPFIPAGFTNITSPLPAETDSDSPSGFLHEFSESEISEDEKDWVILKPSDGDSSSAALSEHWIELPDISKTDPLQYSHLLLAQTPFNPRHAFELRERVRSQQQKFEALHSSLDEGLQSIAASIHDESTLNKTTEAQDLTTHRIEDHFVLEEGASIDLKKHHDLQDSLNQGLQGMKASALDKESAITASPIISAEQLECQINHLQLKDAALTQYLRSNPFNDKNVLRPRRNLAEGVCLLSERTITVMEERIKNILPGMTHKQKEELAQEKAELERAIPQLRNSLATWHAAEIAACEAADPEACSYPPEFYLKDKTAANPLVYYTETYFLNQLQQLYRAAGVPEKITQNIKTKNIRSATEHAMNEVQSWDPVIRDMTVAFNDKTKRFRQIAVPLSASGTAVGNAIRAQRVHGIVPATRADGRAPINTRMTTLVELLDQKDEDGNYRVSLVHERLQHGVNDHFHLEEPKRTEANNRSAVQLIQYGIEADSLFVRELLRKKESEDATPSSVFFINTNLTTPTKTVRDIPESLSGKKGTHDERDYSNRQGMALNEASGACKNFHLSDPDTQEMKLAEANVTCIDLRFPVNYALDSVGVLDLGMMSAWNELHAHNLGEFEKLFGSLETKGEIGGLIGPTYKKLRALATDTTKTEEERTMATTLRRSIEDQSFLIRSLFQSKAYQSAADGDRMKMPRHIDLLANKFREATRLLRDFNTRVINAGGCMSGKDREGVAHAEAVAAVMIEKMGSIVSPGHAFSDEERVIYDTAVSLVVDNTLLVTGYGGSKNAEEVASRIGDHDAVIYDAGLSGKAKT